MCAVYTRRSSGETGSSAHGRAPDRPSQQRKAAPGQRASSKSGGQPKLYGYTITRELPHQQEAFTQGLEFERRCAPKAAGEKKGRCRDILWESTGSETPRLLALSPKFSETPRRDLALGIVGRCEACTQASTLMEWQITCRVLLCCVLWRAAVRRRSV